MAGERSDDNRGFDDDDFDMTRLSDALPGFFGRESGRVEFEGPDAYRDGAERGELHSYEEDWSVQEATALKTDATAVLGETMKRALLGDDFDESRLREIESELGSREVELFGQTVHLYGPGDLGGSGQTDSHGVREGQGGSYADDVDVTEATKLKLPDGWSHQDDGVPLSVKAAAALDFAGTMSRGMSMFGDSLSFSVDGKSDPDDVREAPDDVPGRDDADEKSDAPKFS